MSISVGAMSAHTSFGAAAGAVVAAGAAGAVVASGAAGAVVAAGAGSLAARGEHPAARPTTRASNVNSTTHLVTRFISASYR